MYRRLGTHYVDRQVDQLSMNCLITVVNVVHHLDEVYPNWVHILAPHGMGLSHGMGYINRAHFNSDGAATKC